jgi:aspartate carbamoyltransferase catalytic subunit
LIKKSIYHHLCLELIFAFVQHQFFYFDFFYVISFLSHCYEGDGTGEHPTQALLDIFTIKSELGVLGSTDSSQPMVVTLLGDLKNGRTVHSLVKLLGMFSNIKLVYVAPAVLAMPAYIIEDLEALGVQQTSSMSLEEAIVCTDVLYVTRIQKERYTLKILLVRALS